LVTWGLAICVFTLDPFWAHSAVLIAAIPTGALVFVHAQRYNVYVQRSAAVVIVATSLSIITLAALLVWFGSGSMNP
jgi:predicted permease